jgi:hypothetical protein
MLTTFTAIFTAVILASLSLAWLQIQQSDAETSRRLCHARPAMAKIIDVGAEPNVKSGDRAATALQLEVLPLYGVPYQTQSPWLVETSHAFELRVGEILPVKIDEKQEKVVFPDVAWAEYDWQRGSI